MPDRSVSEMLLHDLTQEFGSPVRERADGVIEIGLDRHVVAVHGGDGVVVEVKLIRHVTSVEHAERETSAFSEKFPPRIFRTDGTQVILSLHLDVPVSSPQVIQAIREIDTFLDDRERELVERIEGLEALPFELGQSEPSTLDHDGAPLARALTVALAFEREPASVIWAMRTILGSASESVGPPELEKRVESLLLDFSGELQDAELREDWVAYCAVARDAETWVHAHELLRRLCAQLAQDVPISDGDRNAWLYASGQLDTDMSESDVYELIRMVQREQDHKVEMAKGLGYI